MKKIRLTLNILCLSMALASAPLQAQGEDNQITLQTEEVSAEDYYITHLATAFFARIASSVLLASGFLASGVKIDPLSKKLNFDEVLEQQGPHMLIPSIAGCAVACYILYKTPQWTDNYFELGVKRTNKDNVKTLLWRCLPYPLGVLVGEYCQRLRNQKRLKKASAKKVALSVAEE